MPGPKRQTELQELSFTGPFGGIQSECPLVEIEGDGFADALDVIFYDGALQPRPGLAYLPVPSPGAHTVLAIFDFFDPVGGRHTGVIAQDGIWELLSGAWVQRTGTLTAIDNYFSWTVVGGQLLFSQGSDPVQLWNGTSATFSPVTGGVPAFHLGELNGHLIACPTIESGAFAPQRLRWTASGNPNDWTGFDAGIADLFNDLGPINGWRKIYQYGYVFQQWGIVTQMPTGNALVPWVFQPLSSRQKGLYFPYTLSGTGEFAVYVAKDNVYLFNGSSSEPIGDMPLRGRSWIGARDRILADLFTSANPDKTYGFYLPSTKSHEFETYWILIPGSSTWVYNFKERNWMRFSWPNDSAVMGTMFQQQQVRIMDLRGTIASQSTTIAGLAGGNINTDAAAISFAGGLIGFFDFVNASDRPWSLTTGTLAFGDTRHSKDIRRIRLCIEPDTSVDITIAATNEQGQSETQVFNIAANPGRTSYQVFPFHIPGFYTQLTLSGPAAQSFRLSEIAVGYGVGKEAATQ